MLKLFERLVVWGLPLIVFSILMTDASLALPYGVGTYGTCQYDTCSLSLTSGGTLSLNISPTSDGVYSTLNDEVEVGTGSSTGYTLSLADADTNTNLVNGGDTVAASSGTQASPIILIVNTWGYRVDGLSGFGAGPTTSQNSSPNSTFTFAGVPASDQTAHSLKVTSAAASPPETTMVWYGARINNTKPSGTYTDQVVYTAVTNE